MLRLKIVVTDEWCYHTINFQHNIHTYNGIIGNVLHLWNGIATLMGPYFACNYYYEVKGPLHTTNPEFVWLGAAVLLH